MFDCVCDILTACRVVPRCKHSRAAAETAKEVQNSSLFVRKSVKFIIIMQETNLPVLHTLLVLENERVFAYNNILRSPTS